MRNLTHQVGLNILVNTTILVVILTIGMFLITNAPKQSISRPDVKCSYSKQFGQIPLCNKAGLPMRTAPLKGGRK